MGKASVSIKEFASKCHQLLRSDRDVIIGVAGFTGEGKSCFSTQLTKAYARNSKTHWDFDRLTWSRAELMEWINGKKNGEIDHSTGLKEGQLPQYSAVLPDELFLMFYRRTWFEEDQISSIATFNMCRDRHLLVVGNVPDIWDLDSGFLKRLRFYIYIVERGRAWVFQQENNPFTKDPWNVTENRKEFRKYKNPYSLKNFICEIRFPDWSTQEKKEYYNIRNTKRVKALDEVKVRKERYKDIKDQRDNIITDWYKDRKLLSTLIKSNRQKSIKKLYGKPLTNKVIADVAGISAEAIRFIIKEPVKRNKTTKQAV